MPRKATKKILILNICKERLHYLEFVKPVEDILKNLGIEFYTKHYTKFTDKDLKAEKIIICGTSLKDIEYLKNISLFRWMGFYEKPILGICGGMQIITSYFKGDIQEETEIGITKVNFKENFIGFNGLKEVYSLHNWIVRVNKDFFNYYAYSEKTKSVQAIKHRKKPIYGVLFHPEVRNKKLIENFCRI